MTRIKAQTPWSREAYRYRFRIPTFLTQDIGREGMPVCFKVHDPKHGITDGVCIPYHVFPDRCECMAPPGTSCRHREMIRVVETYFCCPHHGVSECSALSDQFALKMHLGAEYMPHILCFRCLGLPAPPGWSYGFGTWTGHWLDRALTEKEIRLCHEMLTGASVKEISELL